MSAAEPAHPAPPGRGIDTAPDADVIPLTKRRGKRGQTPRSGRWNHMDNHQPPRDGRNRSDHEIVADFAEKTFNGIDRTLSNDETALIFLKSLDLVIHVLAGAQAKGRITEGQRDDLVELLDALRAAPDLV